MARSQSILSINYPSVRGSCLRTYLGRETKRGNIEAASIESWAIDIYHLP